MYILTDKWLDGLGQASNTIDLDRAVRTNAQYAKSLQWLEHMSAIMRLVGFTPSLFVSSSENLKGFAEAVARWQQSQGLSTADGIIGSKTWKRMQNALGSRVISASSKDSSPSRSSTSCKDIHRMDTPEKQAFLEQVLTAHIAKSIRIKGKALPDLSNAQLKQVPGTRVQMRTDAAIAAGKLLAAANQDLKMAQQAGNSDALKTIQILATSGYRDHVHQECLWRKYFKNKYYNRTASHREKFSDGEHGDKAIKYMVEYVSPKIAAPGFSNHQAGLAIDFWQDRTKGNTIENSTDSQAVEAWKRSWFFQWLQNNATRLDFYPYKKEPWHWIYMPPSKH
jgi:LAS superfamily LD-carboxypeptidase LdcB